jgi:rhodanese-related sulfurtransferase
MTTATCHRPISRHYARLRAERGFEAWLRPAEASLDIANRDLQVIVLCSEGYSSSLAAAALQDLGVHRATDVIGGYAAWRESGLPSAAQAPRTRTGSPGVDSSGD